MPAILRRSTPSPARGEGDEYGHRLPRTQGYPDGIDMSHTIVHTTDMKTAISIPDELFKSVDELAAKSGWSRSQIFVEAVKEYIEKRRTRRMLDTLNRVYAGPETEDEIELRELGKRAYAKRLKAERKRW